jgi:hypothetical protein
MKTSTGDHACPYSLYSDTNQLTGDANRNFARWNQKPAEYKFDA